MPRNVHVACIERRNAFVSVGKVNVESVGVNYRVIVEYREGKNHLVYFAVAVAAYA